MKYREEEKKKGAHGGDRDGGFTWACGRCGVAAEKAPAPGSSGSSPLRRGITRSTGTSAYGGMRGSMVEA
jgi:hypothetical protein